MSVYRLESLSGYDNEGNCIFDVFNLPFDGDDAFFLQYGSPNSPFQFPKSLIMFGDQSNLFKKNSLASRFQRYIWDKKVINTLLEIGDFEYMFLPIHIFDSELYQWACKNNNQNFPDYADANTSFGFVRFLRNENMLDCFDFEKSEYSPPRRPGGIISRIKKLVLRSDSDFPAVFSDKTATGEFISQAAKDALDANGIYLPLTEIEVS